MTSIHSRLLETYKELVLLSLSAQARDDIEQEDRAIDALDALWEQMSPSERIESEDLNRAITAWFDSPMRFEVEVAGSLSHAKRIPAVRSKGWLGKEVGVTFAHWQGGAGNRDFYWNPGKQVIADRLYSRGCSIDRMALAHAC